MKEKSFAGTALLAVMASLPAAAAASQPAPYITPPQIELTLAPTLAADGNANGLDVHYTLRQAATTQPWSLQWDLLAPSPGRSSDQPQRLTVADDRGTLTLTASMDRAEGLQHYKSDRIPEGTVRVSYHIPVASPHPKLRGAHREMQAAGGGVTTSGDGIFLFPPLAGPVAIKLHWNNPPGFNGTSSFGDADWSRVSDADQIRNGFYLSGPLRRFPADAATVGFSARGLGDNDIDLPQLFTWSSHAYDATRQAFDGARDKQFRLFYRTYDGGPLDSGRADQNGILLYLAPRHNDLHTLADLKHLIAHEMIHVWQPDITDDSDTAWFTEGSADYFASVITFEQHLMSQADYVRLINVMATQYYGNARRNLPNQALHVDNDATGDAWMLPYNRGFLYFADLDARVRQRSGAKSSLLTLFKEFVALSRHGVAPTTKAWRQLVVQHAGAAGGEALDAMLEGKTIIPVEGAFGRCAKAENTILGVFDLGYTKTKTGNVVSTVAINSTAERAGLKVGDRLAGNLTLDPFYGDHDRVLDLPIKRDGTSMVIRYRPRNGAVNAVRWVASPAPDCHGWPGGGS